MKEVLTTCPYCGCGCNFYLLVDNGECTGVIPSREHHISGGKLCVKGGNAYEFINHPDRLLNPCIRNEDILQEVSWNEALDYTATKLKAIIEKYGPDSVGFFSSSRCTNEENFLLTKFARAVVGTNNIDNCARL